VVGWVVGPCEAVEEDGVAFFEECMRVFGMAGLPGSPVNGITKDPVRFALS
jgi:hypothetical protein